MIGESAGKHQNHLSAGPARTDNIAVFVLTGGIRTIHHPPPSINLSSTTPLLLLISVKELHRTHIMTTDWENVPPSFPPSHDPGRMDVGQVRNVGGSLTPTIEATLCCGCRKGGDGIRQKSGISGSTRPWPSPQTATPTSLGSSCGPWCTKGMTLRQRHRLLWRRHFQVDQARGGDGESFFFFLVL